MSDTSALEPNPAPAPEELVLDDPAPEPSDDGLEELEIGPEKYKVAKPIKEAWAGLQKTVQTEKEQIKTERAQIEAEKAKTAEYAKLQTALFDEIAELKGIDKQLAPYMKLTPSDWMAWADQDPEAARKAQIAVTALQNQRGQLVQSAQAKGQELDAQNRKTQAERMAAAEKEIAAKIKDWSPAKKEALTKYASDNGISPDELAPLASDWRTMAVLEKAQKYDQAVARAAAAREAAAKQAKEQQGEPEPTPRVKANSGSSSNIPTDKDPPDVWLKKRNAQLRAANR